MKPLRYQCPVMYRPTFPVRLARPSGKRLFAESRSRWELQAWPDAITNVPARNSTGSSGASRSTASATAIRSEPGSRLRRRTSVRVTRSMRPSASSRSKAKSGVYLAPVGQTEQVSHRRQTFRPCQGSVLRAQGCVQKGMSVFSVHSRMRSRLYESGSGGMG